MTDKPAYTVEAEGKACGHCGLGEMWNVVFMVGTPQEIALGISFGDCTDAEEMADAVNDAFDQGLGAAEAALQAMAIDRDLWRDAHDEDCPNQAMLESTEAQVRELARALQGMIVSETASDIKTHANARDHAMEVLSRIPKELLSLD